MFILQMYVGGILLIELAVTGLVGGLLIGLVHSILARRFIIGSLCCIFAVTMYLPLMYHEVCESGVCIIIIRCIHNHN